MALLKAEGIVVRTMNMGETSKLVTFFSRELGILKFVAKGVRSSKSRMGAALEPLTLSRIVYYHKENRDLQFLSQADLVEFFPNLTADAEKWGYANACAELITRAQTSPEATSKLYPILLNTLRAMNEPAIEGRVCFWGFQMKFVGVLGLAPSLRRCSSCGTAGSPNRIYQFDFSRGGFFCDKCSLNPGLHKISGETLQALSDFQALPAEKFVQYKISPAAAREIENFFRGYLAFHLEEIGKLTSLKFVHKIASQKISSAK
ncbi:MAG: DNA repair protein RecO [candidate division KSB1 bacterium]|nr:DNA repair protein RecO [candidate division KSB1 bacterium]MDZ7368390.1 DNA repair protein RecO [candidate division KSB1 bacterium]MDZ7406034.1 DNA repair protein RecO [candidate division KSB1 bacterium]